MVKCYTVLSHSDWPSWYLRLAECVSNISTIALRAVRCDVRPQSRTKHGQRLRPPRSRCKVLRDSEIKPKELLEDLDVLDANTCY